ncbi:transcriptional regulator [Thermoleptolyngbya sichuanensis XZ-Cy5]|uniref:helix-turn-helix transcriptional regulator n=1 Tax=Thermoleptolyngbya sichuanensis TaxID=2885951 RepID=UPI00240D837B|nr:metalloregulator ArsR/SmtB family transcription factor [Thermoleptolyngbya sichuanensis]MDG2616709.1 transcriptional regulator [Thermoleptolyngbya sichuanensis XZ-Cy5]
MEDTKPRAKDQILHLLKMRGAQTAAALAEQLEISPMAVRQHLQTLKAEQWVTYRQERRPTGRPVKLWQLTEHSVSRFPDSHADLMLDVLRGVETVFGAEGLERVISERSRRQVQTYRAQLAGVESWQAQVRAIAHFRSQEGYMAEVLEQPDGLLLVENHCPICAAAQTCPGLCTAELEVFRSVLGTSVVVERVEHLMQGDRRCAYRIQPTR